MKDVDITLYIQIFGSSNNEYKKIVENQNDHLFDEIYQNYQLVKQAGISNIITIIISSLNEDFIDSTVEKFEGSLMQFAYIYPPNKYYTKKYYNCRALEYSATKDLNSMFFCERVNENER